MGKIIGVVGCNGNLGQSLVENGCIPLTCDIRDKSAIKSEIKRVQPNIIINCAAITDVDECEEEMSKMAYLVNCASIANLRDAFLGNIIHISTSYVFDGKKKEPYTEQDEPNPLSVYAKSKYGGEERFLDYNMKNDCIVRTVTLYGGHKADFVTKVLRQIRDGREVTLPNTLMSNPTYIPHLVKSLIHLANMETRPRILNLVGAEVMSRYEFAIMAANVFGWQSRLGLLQPTTKITGNAPRPKNAGLSTKLARRYKIPIFKVLDGLTQMYVQKNFLYGRHEE